MNSTVKKFEQDFLFRFNSTGALAFWKGRVALYAILKALDLKPDDEVIVPGYTCVMNVNPLKYLKLVPIYVDIEPVTYNIDVNLLSEKITPKTRMIIAQHTYGYPCAMDIIMQIARRHNLCVIEDCCLALGSKYQGQTVGTFGPAAYFSFQWNKPFTTGLGGLALINDQDVWTKMENLYRENIIKPPAQKTLILTLQRLIYRMFIYPRTTAMATSIFRWLTNKGWVVGSSGRQEYVPEMPEDFFMAMGTSQAKAGLRQMKKMEENITHRQKMGKFYHELLCDAGFKLPEIPDDMDPVLVRYPLRVSDKQKVLVEMPAHGVEIGSWFECPLHPMETPLPLYDYQPGMCPVAEKAAAEVINLPLHPRVNEKTARKTVEFIAKFI